MHLRTYTQTLANQRIQLPLKTKILPKLAYPGLPCPNSCTSSESILPRLIRTSRRTMFPVLDPKAKIQNPKSQKSISPSASRPSTYASDSCTYRMTPIFIPLYPGHYPPQRILSLQPTQSVIRHTTPVTFRVSGIGQRTLDEGCSCLYLPVPACLRAHATQT